MSSSFILAIDQGTSGTKAIVFDRNARIVAEATEPLASSFPAPGFVEQDPGSIRMCWPRSRPASTDLRPTCRRT